MAKISFYTGLNAGVTQQSFSFPAGTFPTIPTILLSLELGTSSNLFTYEVSGVSSTGFTVLFSDVLTSGNMLNVYARI